VNSAVCRVIEHRSDDGVGMDVVEMRDRDEVGGVVMPTLFGEKVPPDRVDELLLQHVAAHPV
jgi:hypothetical protein